MQTRFCRTAAKWQKDSPPRGIYIELKDVYCLMLVFDGKEVLGNWAGARVINDTNKESERAGAVIAHSRGLQGHIGFIASRPGVMGGGAMEINTVPRFDAKDAQGVIYSKIPRLQFPLDNNGRTMLVQDVTYYSKAALCDAFKAWRDGGPACSGRFDANGTWRSTLKTRTPRFDQAGKEITGVDKVFDTKVFESNLWGLQWNDSDLSPKGFFPQYTKHVGDERVAVSASDVPPRDATPD